MKIKNEIPEEEIRDGVNDGKKTEKTPISSEFKKVEKGTAKGY